jgi:signal transduction histidine kinase/ligand-binding sensor domain-containing protein
MGKGIVATLTALLAILPTYVPVHAQDRDQAIRQFHHTTWTAKDGAPPDIWALDQGPDGFLWLGTGSGLYRFDGVAFERYRPASGEQLASIDITAVEVLPSNEIWVGYSDGGASRLKDGRVTTFTEKDGIGSGMIVHFRQDRDGVLWAVSHGGLSRFLNGRWHKVGADWNVPADFIVGLFIARDGVRWLSTAQSIYFARPGTQKFEPTDAVAEHATLTQTPDGRIWVADRPHGLRPLPNYVDGDRRNAWTIRTVPSGNVLSLASFAVDRRGVLWGTDRVNGGIFRFDPLHTPQPTHSLMASDVDVFRRTDGLTAGRSIPILSDREGNIWVGTSAGLNRFRTSEIVHDAAIPPATAYGYSIAALSDATYITDGVWLYRAPPREAARRHTRLSVAANTVLLRSAEGALWYGNGGFMHRLFGGKAQRVSLPEKVRDRNVNAIAEDGTGALWAAFEGSDVYQLKGGRWTGPVDLGGLPTPVIAGADTAGAVWFGYADSRVSRHDAAGMRVFTARDGLAVGNVEGIAVLDGAVWVGGELGVARLDGERFHTIGPDQVEALFGVSGIGQAADGDVLFNGLMGIVRIDTEELRKAFTTPAYVPNYALYDRRNGLPGVAQQGWHAPTVASGADGRTWFISNTGVSFLNADGRARNLVPPAVSILSATVQGVVRSTAGPLTLPKGATSLTIAYTAAALRAPESVRFRYRLEGLDTGWTEAGGHREATFSNLGPRQYRFHVIAANEDGVWNEEGATLDVEIPPTFLQSWPFKALVGATLVALLWLVYTQRMRSVARRIHGRMAERLEERERIARALHDTLLQSVQALTLRFQFAVDRLPVELPARGALEEAIDRADVVIAEGRDRIQGLRLLRDGAVEDIIAGIVKRQGFDAAVEVVVTCHGTPRALDLLVLDEVTRIAGEAVFNVWRHASATRIAIDISHGTHFSLRIADNGVGIDPDVVTRGEREGHFGLPGMRESARKLRGVLDVRCLPEGGAEVALIVPASIAYQARGGRRGTRSGPSSMFRPERPWVVAPAKAEE